MANLYEAKLVGNITDHGQVTIANTSGATMYPDEVIFIANSSGIYVPYVIREEIANGASGEAQCIGEFSFKKESGAVFVVGDDLYWHGSANTAVTRAMAKTGDYYLGRCSKAAASGDSHVWGRLGENLTSGEVISTSSSISVSVCSSSQSSSSGSTSSVSSTSTSSSSDSKTSKSVSSNSDSSTSDLSVSSNSDSSSSSLISISSNSDSSSSESVSV